VFPVLLLAVLHATACARDPGCADIAGIEPLLEPGTILLPGGIHGTRQSPAFARAVACHVLERGRKVMLALEIPTGEEPRAEAYLESRGEKNDLRALLEGAFWNVPMKNGLSSRAMVDLVEGARILRHASGDLDVRLFDRPAEEGSPGRDRRMAKALREIVASAPDAVVVVLTGNVHARVAVGASRDPGFEPMGTSCGAPCRTEGSSRSTWSTRSERRGPVRDPNPRSAGSSP